MRTLTAVRQVVFCDVGGRFAGMASPGAIVDGLAGVVPELRDRLRAGEDLFIVDLRSQLDGQPITIPGAVRISSEDLTSRRQEIPRDREIILFCG